MFSYYFHSHFRGLFKSLLWCSSLLQRELVSSHFDSGRPTDEEGVEDAFEVLHENDERVRTGIWVGDCFIYNNSSWKLNYCVGGEVLKSLFLFLIIFMSYII